MKLNTPLLLLALASATQALQDPDEKCADKCCWPDPTERRNRKLQVGGDWVCESALRVCQTGLTSEECLETLEEHPRPFWFGSFCPARDDVAGCMGDPHFKTWTGEWYDYHGICDLVLLSIPEFGKGLGLNLHIRTAARYQYSFIESAAVQIGDDVLEVGSFGEYMWNGIDASDLPVKMAGLYEVSYHKHMAGDHVVDEKRHQFVIELSQDPNRSEKIVINTFKDIVSVKFEGATSENFRHSMGLMGDFARGSLLARDGKTVMKDDLLAFGQEWQVLESEPKLFQVPTTYKTCMIPTVSASAGRRLGEASVSREDAEAACAHWGDSERHLCVADVLVMEDLEMAHAGAF